MQGSGDASGGQSQTQSHNALGLRHLTRRLDILRRNYLDHRFDRRSPLQLISADLLSRIHSVEVTLPPRRYLMQPGTQTIDGLFFLASLAAVMGARTIFEIGTFTGVTTWTMSRNVPDAVVHTLDISPREAPRWRLAEDDTHRGSREKLLYGRLPGAGEIVQHWSDSATFDFAPFYDSIDLVYIDGAHAEPYVRSDTEQALRMMSPRGAIVWDDYWRHSPGVLKVLHGRQDLGLLRIPGTRLVAHLTPEAEKEIGRGR